MEPGMAFVIALVFILGSFRLLRPLVNAIADILRSRLERRDALPDHDAEIEALHDLVESLSYQLSRLSERVEFTEKLLENPREAPEPEVKTPTG